jgi:hypothetical protein
MNTLRYKFTNKEYILSVLIVVSAILAISFAVKAHAANCTPTVSYVSYVSGACPVPVSSSGIAQKTVIQANTMQYTAPKPVNVSGSVVPLYWNASGTKELGVRHVAERQL